MYELLVRIETLCLNVQPSALVAVGAALAVIGFFLWLGGVRYSTVVLGLLGAAVGAVVGLIVAQRFNVHLFGSMAAGAAVLGIVAVLVRNILIIVLATVVFAIVGGATYTGIILDTQPAVEETQAQSSPQTRLTAQGEPRFPAQSFSSMDPNSRQIYLNQISGQEEGFQDRLTALLKDTWTILGPHKWFLFAAIVVGAVAGFLLIWLVKNVVLPFCYSIVGTASLLLGALLVLLGAGVNVTGGLPPQRWILPTVFGSITLVGWLRQLLAGRARQAAPSEARSEKHDD